MARMKVLALSYLFPNAEQPNHGIFVYNRLNALSKYVDIKVINPIPWSPIHSKLSQYAYLEQIPEKTTLGNLEVFHPRFLSIPKYLKTLEAITYKAAVDRIINNELSNFDFDVIDLHWTYPDLPTGYSLSQKFNKPYLVSLRGYEAFHIPDPGFRKNIVKHYLKQTDQIIALSHDLKKISIDLGAPEEKHQVIRNGVDVECFSFINKSDAREKLNIPLTEKVIISIGRIVKPKGFDLIINALPEIIEKSTCKDIKLYIIGTPDPADDFTGELKGMISKLKLEKNVVFQGGVANQDLVNWYNAADIFCLASRGEGSPNVLTEALSCGCPSVATDVGAVKEIIASEPDIGECVPSDDSKALGVALSNVLNSDYDRQHNAKVFSKYSWDWCAQKVLEVYKKAIENPIK